MISNFTAAYGRILPSIGLVSPSHLPLYLKNTERWKILEELDFNYHLRQNKNSTFPSDGFERGNDRTRGSRKRSTFNRILSSQGGNGTEKTQWEVPALEQPFSRCREIVDLRAYNLHRYTLWACRSVICFSSFEICLPKLGCSNWKWLSNTHTPPWRGWDHIIHTVQCPIRPVILPSTIAKT